MTYRRSFEQKHRKQQESFGYGSFLPPLSVPETLKLHASFVQKGFMEASKWNKVVDTLATNKTAASRIIKSSLLQLVLLFSALTIKPILSVIPNNSRRTTHGIIYLIFVLFWLYPLAAAATYYSGLLQASQDQTESTSGRRRNPRAPAADYKGMVNAFITEALVLFNYLLFMYLLSWVPLLGRFVAFFYACFVSSYYIFEPLYIRQSRSFPERVAYLEERYSYFAGFGFAITFFSYWSRDPLVNLALFQLLYPLFTIMAPTAMPLPIDPKMPTNSMSFASMPATGGTSFSIASAEGGEEARGRRGHPSIPKRLPLLVLADTVYRTLNATFGGLGGRRKKEAGPSHHVAAMTGMGSSGPASSYPSAAPMPYGEPSYQQQGAPSAGYANGYSPARGNVAPAGYSQPAYGSAASGTPSTRRTHQFAGEAEMGGSPGARAGEYVDRRMNSYINDASRRKKGE